MLVAALLAVRMFSVDAAIVEKLDSGFSPDRERGSYALARLYDPEDRKDRELFQRVVSSASGAERAALLQGLADRAWEAPPSDLESRLSSALADADSVVRALAVDATERLPRERAVRHIPDAFADARTSFDPTRVLGRLFVYAARNPDPAWKNATIDAAEFRIGQLKGAHPPLDAFNARLLEALAAEGIDVEPLLPSEERAPSPAASASPGDSSAASPTPSPTPTPRRARDAKPDYWRTARANAVRAAAGDAAALSALVETATTAAEPALRREALDLLGTLPPGARAKGLRAAASRLEDSDVLARGALIAAFAREPASPVAEAVFVRALRDELPAQRFAAAAALGDRAASLSDAAVAALTAARADTDPLAHAAIAWALARHAAVPPPEPSPAPSPSATPADSASPMPSAPAAPPASPSPTPAKPFPYPWAPPVHRPR